MKKFRIFHFMKESKFFSVPLGILLFSSLAFAAEFQSFWPEDLQRIWIGSEYWSNRLQDWQISNGRLECTFSGPDRNVHILTHDLHDKPGTLNLSVDLGSLNEGTKDLPNAWVGFKIGAKGEFHDYRDSAVRGQGLHAGLYMMNRLFIGQIDSSGPSIEPPFEFIQLRLQAEPLGNFYKVTLAARDKFGKVLSQISRRDIERDQLLGNLALACSSQEQDGNIRFWFKNWRISGTKVAAHPDRTFGPVLFAQYTLSRNILKLTAQMPPVGSDSRRVALQIQGENQEWKTVAHAPIDEWSRTATFRLPGWDSSREVPYRLVYEIPVADGKIQETYFNGIIRRDPVDKETLVVAGFTGNNDLGFPHNDLVDRVAEHDPDLLFFSGDQIYEGVGGYGFQRSPVETACLDYLRKWYIFGWCYRDLMRSRPAVCIPDDHDVYHGNIWGCGGKPAIKGATGYEEQDSGGYKMPPEWVNMVQRTQTSHLPDPYDPAPVQQGIGVYYCEMNYGGISFAILEDRKFKSAPKLLLPQAKVVNGWAQNKDFDPKTEADAPGAVLLGERQLGFLRHWAEDWSGHAWMKVALSQTLFANVATLPEGERIDQIVPKLRILFPGEYPENDRCVADMDSNGWPQTPRNHALREMRRAFAFHLSGDQHLGSTIQYGVEEWNDAGFAFCVPAVSNIWPRRWFPSTPGRNRQPNAPEYTGEFEDGFGNKMTVHAVSNPVHTGLDPGALYDRATGFGIVRFHRASRAITIECWARAPDDENPRQFPGWPITIHQLDNYNRKAAAFLPTIRVSGTTDPVIQVVDEADGEVVYTLRIQGNAFQPKVFKPGFYTVRISQPDEQKTQTFTRVQSISPEKSSTMEVHF